MVWIYGLIRVNCGIRAVLNRGIRVNLRALIRLNLANPRWIRVLIRVNPRAIRV